LAKEGRGENEVVQSVNLATNAAANASANPPANTTANVVGNVANNVVMGKAPLLWLDNLSAECITSWATLSQLFTTNYQMTYNRPGNTHHQARVWMRRDETL
jgi:hypothetical protein